MKKIKIKNKKIFVSLKKNKIQMKGPLGELDYNFDNSFIFLQKNKIFIPKKKYLFFCKKINELQKSLTTGWLFQLRIDGKGFKIFPYNNYYCFDLGYSNLFLFKIKSPKIKLLLLKKKLIIFGINKSFIFNLSNIISNFYYKDKYHGKGLYLTK